MIELRSPFIFFCTFQFYGEVGYVAQRPFEKFMRDAKLFEVGGGTNGNQLQTIAWDKLS